MLIVCPSCASQYEIDADRIGPVGRQVRCSQCAEGWFAKVADPARAAPEAPTPPAPVVDGGALRSRIRPSARARLAKRQAGRSRATAAAAFVLALGVILGIPTAVTMRSQIVAAMPRTERAFAVVGLPVNLVGVNLDAVVSNMVDEAGKPTLVTEGTISNPTGAPVRLPKLDITVESAGGDILYRWSTDPPLAVLPSGETTRFNIRLASPPPDGRGIVVTFLPRGEEAYVASR